MVNWYCGMSGDTKVTDWEGTDFTDRTDRSLITDISATITYMSAENRAKRRRERLREELVREHIGNQHRSPSFLKSAVNKLFISK